MHREGTIPPRKCPGFPHSPVLTPCYRPPTHRKGQESAWPEMSLIPGSREELGTEANQDGPFPQGVNGRSLIRRASPSPYCSPLVFVSKLNTNWSVCLIIQLIFQGLSYLLGSIQKYRVLRRSLCGCHSCWARSLEVSACRSLSPESLLHPDFSQSNYTFI